MKPCQSKGPTVVRKLRLLFVNSSTVWGGNEKWTLNAARGLQARGHRVRIAYRGEAVGERLAQYGFPGEHVSMRSDLDVFSVIRLMRLVRRDKTDVLILTKHREYWLGGIAGRIAKVPLIFGRLGLVRIPKDTWKNRLIYGGHLLDHLIVNAAAIKEGLKACGWIDGKCIHVIYNGIALPKSGDRDGMDVRKEFGIAGRSPLILGVGRLTKQKGFDFLLQAGRTVIREIPDAKIMIVGTGVEQETLRNQAEVARIGPNVIFPGLRKDVDVLLKAADVFVLSSRNEGMANVLLEAMALGTPVISTRCGGSHELITHGKNGLLVDFGDVEALSRAIINLLREKARTSRLEENAARFVEDRFSLDQMIDKMEHVLYSKVRLFPDRS
ncbi:MAG: glycosyltransferase [Candidatus Latescibacteria bacterium]|nr:glycosyltransferase [Candidatus Latescibacterota bacterium]